MKTDREKQIEKIRIITLFFIYKNSVLLAEAACILLTFLIKWAQKILGYILRIFKVQTLCIDCAIDSSSFAATSFLS